MPFPAVQLYCSKFASIFPSHFFRTFFVQHFLAKFTYFFVQCLRWIWAFVIPRKFHMFARNRLTRNGKLWNLQHNKKFVCKMSCTTIFLSRLNPIKKSLYEHMHFYHLNWMFAQIKMCLIFNFTKKRGGWD